MFLIIILIIIVIVILLVLVSITRRKQAQVPPPEPADASQINEMQEEEMEALGTKKESLLKAIKKLDSDFEEGIIDEDVYLELKSGYKQKTVDVMKRMDALTAMAVVTVKEPDTSPEAEALRNEKEKLLLSIKKLDSDYKDGVIDEETYNEMRDDYKKKAIEITKKLENI
jgi:competence protein ComGC